MEWNEFEPLKLNTPDEIILSKIKGFGESTKNLVDMKLIAKSDFDRITSKLYSDFQYELVIHSKYISGYSFTLLEVGYDITIYPTRLLIDLDIYDEMNDAFSIDRVITEIDTEEGLNKALELIFKTTRFKKLVSGVMKIASKGISDFQS